MRRLMLAVLACLAWTLPAHAQTMGVSTTQTSGTVAVTNTFQVALAFNAARRGGFYQNTGTAFQFVFFAGNAATCAAATKPASIQLQPPTGTSQGGSVTFQVGPTGITDTVCITGTAADTFSLATAQ